MVHSSFDAVEARGARARYEAGPGVSTARVLSGHKAVEAYLKLIELLKLLKYIEY